MAGLCGNAPALCSVLLVMVSAIERDDSGFALPASMEEGMAGHLHGQSECKQMRSRSTKAKTIISLGLTRLVACAVLFMTAASVVGVVEAAMATLSLLLVGVLLLIVGMSGSRS